MLNYYFIKNILNHYVAQFQLQLIINNNLKLLLTCILCILEAKKSCSLSGKSIILSLLIAIQTIVWSSNYMVSKS